MNPQFTELYSVPIDAPLANYWKAIEIFMCNPRIASKNVAGIILDFAPIFQFSNCQNLSDLQCLALNADPNALQKRLKSLIDYEQEVTLDELKNNFNHPDGTKSFAWIVKILYKNIKYRSFTHKCYIIGKSAVS